LFLAHILLSLALFPYYSVVIQAHEALSCIATPYPSQAQGHASLY